MRAFLELVELGLSPLLPQLTEFIEIECGIRLPHATWMDLDMPWVEASDIVLRLPGDSTGADLEVAHAAKFGLPVFYSLDEIREWMRSDNKRRRKPWDIDTPETKRLRDIEAENEWRDSIEPFPLEPLRDK